MSGSIAEATAITFMVQLVLGAVASFLAIVLWSRTRDAAWVFIVLGTVLYYAVIVVGVLERVGVAAPGEVEVLGVAALEPVLHSLPLVCFIVGFSIMLVRRRGW